MQYIEQRKFHSESAKKSCKSLCILTRDKLPFTSTCPHSMLHIAPFLLQFFDKTSSPSVAWDRCVGGTYGRWGKYIGNMGREHHRVRPVKQGAAVPLAGSQYSVWHFYKNRRNATAHYTTASTWQMVWPVGFATYYVDPTNSACIWSLQCP